MPPAGVPYPFPQPDQEAELILGEWWNADVEVIERQGDDLGLPPNTSDAHTINGKPGPLFPCPEKRNLLRIINAALNDDLFFAIAGHNMTIVEIDATYVKPFSMAAVVVAPGQTTNVLVQADQPPEHYFIAARSFMDVPLPIDNKTAIAVFQYKGVTVAAGAIPAMPRLPAPNDTAFVNDFQDKLKSLKAANMPTSVDRRLFYTIGMGVNPCPTCANKTRLVGSLNNITFVMPEVALLQAHYNHVRGVYRLDFPDRPTKAFNYTGAPLTANLGTSRGTRLGRLTFNSTVELVLQDTNLLMVESHPFHLHGYNFFVVGRGIGNFDPAKDPAKFNLVDPPERNTMSVPTGGWTAIRFRANNPGVWFMHCHLEVHTTWGLKMAFLVEDGDGPDESVLPPPADFPPC